MPTTVPIPTNSELRATLEAVFSQLTGRPLQGCQLFFYPYVGLQHTIRWRGRSIELRLSDILHDAPLEVLRAISLKLLYKLLGRGSPPAATRAYHAYVARSEIVERARQTRRRRGRKRISPPRGQVFDLEELFSELNARYFEGALMVDRLGWSPGRSRRILGHFDPAHKTIVISTRLDNPLVPRYVVSYVLYHEMLHAALGEEIHNGRRLIHHREFKLAEKRFGDIRKARRFIRAHFSGLSGARIDL